MSEDPRVCPGTGSLAQLVNERAGELGTQIFCEDGREGRVLGYAELAEAVRRYTDVLARYEVPAGGRVLLDVDDPLTFVAAYVGVLAAGRCAAPVNPRAPEAELQRSAAAIRPSVVLSDQSRREDVLEAPVLAADPSPQHGDAIAADTSGSVLLLTSGSTGEPKAVELTEGRLLHVARAVAAHNRLSSGDRGYNPLPLFHINAQVVAVLATLHAGAALVLDRKFQRHECWQRLADHDVTWVNAVPAILTLLADEPVTALPGTLRFLRSASAPLPAAVRHRVTEKAGVPVVESYGMTEAASQITATPLDGSAPDGSCGVPVGVELQVRDVSGGVLGPELTGRVWIRGEGVIDGYVAGRAADRFDEDGWLDTRDMGHLDRDGYLHLAGRSDDVINRGGEMLHPREIEEVLIAEPNVQDAVVVGRPDPVLGEVPVAYLLPVETPSSAEAERALLDRVDERCGEHLSRYKRPSSMHLVENFPRAATGKIQRHRLREPELTTR